MNLNLKRPLVFFDLETTGTNILNDRIVEISYVKVFPDPAQPVEEKTRRINPEMHIPEQSTAVHHITDEDVKDCPTFRQIANSLFNIFEGCDIAGFNSNKFDIPLLMEEFSRANLKFDLSSRRLIDVQNIFHKKEPRTLVAAYRYYCGKDLENAHSALADTRATYEVLMGQLDKYPDLDNDVDALASFSRMNRNIDLEARLVLNDKDEPCFNFGKFKGHTVESVFRNEPSYYDWMLRGSFSKNTKDELMKLKFAFDQKNKK